MRLPQTSPVSSPMHGQALHAIANQTKWIIDWACQAAQLWAVWIAQQLVTFLPAPLSRPPYYTVKGSRREVSFDSQNGKYASQLSCDASPEVYL
jgi:hypothetical protein